MRTPKTFADFAAGRRREFVEITTNGVGISVKERNGQWRGACTVVAQGAELMFKDLVSRPQETREDAIAAARKNSGGVFDTLSVGDGGAGVVRPRGITVETLAVDTEE